MVENRSEEEKQIASAVTLESVLKNIHYYRVHDYVEQIALINVLPSVLQDHLRTKLIVMDSDVSFSSRL
jgi:RAD51-like protein 2